MTGSHPKQQWLPSKSSWKWNNRKLNALRWWRWKWHQQGELLLNLSRGRTFFSWYLFARVIVADRSQWMRMAFTLWSASLVMDFQNLLKSRSVRRNNFWCCQNKKADTKGRSWRVHPRLLLPALDQRHHPLQRRTRLLRLFSYCSACSRWPWWAWL